jgi:hypothetical protein
MRATAVSPFWLSRSPAFFIRVTRLYGQSKKCSVRGSFAYKIALARIRARTAPKTLERYR